VGTSVVPVALREPGMSGDDSSEGAAAHRVLIVDDDDAMRRLLGLALVSFGCDAYQARGAGPEVLAALRDRSMCAVIVDLSGPSTSCWRVLQALGGPMPGRRPATIAIAADARTLDLASELGVGAILLKPFSLQQLQGAIEGLVALEGSPHLPTVPLYLSSVSAVQRSPGARHCGRSPIAS
jgi:CheY-like chemotaxis protein